MSRYRLTYSKKGDARFIGHLDEAKTWERIFRRADLPLAYSQGFNPQPRVQFAAALPVGVEGEAELLDVWTTTPLEPPPWLDRLRRTLPPGFTLLSLVEVPAEWPAMQASLRLAEYEVQWEADLSPTLLHERVEELLRQETIRQPHHKDPSKSYDLRPLIADLHVLPPSTTGPGLAMQLQSGPQGSARVTAVVAALKLDHLPHRIRRTRLHLTLNSS